MNEKHKLVVMELKCIRSKFGVCRVDRGRNEEVTRRVGLAKSLIDTVET